MQALFSILVFATCFNFNAALISAAAQESATRASSIMEEAMLLLTEEKKLAEHDQQMSAKFSQLRNEQTPSAEASEAQKIEQRQIASAATPAEKLALMEKMQHEEHLKQLQELEHLEHLEHLEKLEHEEYLEHMQHLDAKKLFEDGVKDMNKQQKQELDSLQKAEVEVKQQSESSDKNVKTEMKLEAVREGSDAKQYACKEVGKEILAFYTEKQESKCMQAQLDMHCMPYEHFAAGKIAKGCELGDITCRHSGLLKELVRRSENDPNFQTDYPVVLILGEDVALDKEFTEEAVKDFVNGYQGAWDIVHLDPPNQHEKDSHGQLVKKEEGDVDEEYRGKKLYKLPEQGIGQKLNAVILKTYAADKLINAGGLGAQGPVLAWEAGVVHTEKAGSQKSCE